MTALSVNLNKIAWLRNARGGDTPSLGTAAETVITAGAAGLTVHPRPDQRHIRATDVPVLAEVLQANPALEYNIEGNPFAGARDNGYPGFDALIEAARPAQATLVPDDDQQLTSDHGFDLRGDQSLLRDKIERYQSLGARVSLFMDPDLAQIDRAAELGTDRIELYTGPFAEAVATSGADSGAARHSFEQFQAAAVHATSLGLGVNAGHDLDLPNLPLFLTIPGILEVSIGHALIARALDRGLAASVTAFLAVIGEAQQAS
ncbi:MAG: pyridoxine 5'-phosphate synthase [Pseudomonadota bacterium]